MVHIIVQLIGAFLACITAAVTLEIPKIFIFKVGVVGTISYFVYIHCLNYLGFYEANFIACLVFATLGHIMARKVKCPVTLFYIPAFFLYVPGTSIYRTALYFIQGDYSLSNHYLIQTLTLAGIIALAVYIVDSAVDIFFHIRKIRQAGLDIWKKH